MNNLLIRQNKNIWLIEPFLISEVGLVSIKKDGGRGIKRWWAKVRRSRGLQDNPSKDLTASICRSHRTPLAHSSSYFDLDRPFCHICTTLIELARFIMDKHQSVYVIWWMWFVINWLSIWSTTHYLNNNYYIPDV